MPYVCINNRYVRLSLVYQNKIKKKKKCVRVHRQTPWNEGRQKRTLCANNFARKGKKMASCTWIDASLKWERKDVPIPMMQLSCETRG